ncbi:MULTISPECIES: hypothetical protein [Mycolicibacterium]|uniref:hypothetical protein n=1 Tax=Mycolicibacterium TaxID=1866885 RepID=UPI001F3F1CC6|nr:MULTISPECIES: hypothetical protein [Mycolicibacterium]
MAIIGVTAAVTLSVAGGGNGDGSPTASPPSRSAANSDIASANDTGPVGIITEDPSCAAQSPVLITLAEKTNNGWPDRDPTTPATEWTPELRAKYVAFGEAMRGAADQLAPLAKLTPHRVMRELYEQFIAYARAYAESIPTYGPRDDYFVRVANLASDAIGNVCAAISYGSAAARAPLVTALSEPSEVAPVGDPTNPQMFLTESNPICGEWDSALTQFYNETSEWESTDPNVPAAQWTPEQRSLNDGVAPVMRRLANQLQVLGERSANPTLRDFAQLSAQYRRAYAAALPSYTPADHYLVTTALKLGGLVNVACQSVSQ